MSGAGSASALLGGRFFVPSPPDKPGERESDAAVVKVTCRRLTLSALRETEKET